MIPLMLALLQGTICVGDCSGGPMVYGPSRPAPVTTCTGLHGRQEWDRLRPPIIIAHRGGGGSFGGVTAPDNTWPGFVWAAGIGCIVECDLQRTKDGHLVCHHDTTIDRMTGRTDGTTVADWTLAELKAMDFSQGHIPALFSPQPITTFEEYLDLARMGFLLAPEVRGGMGTEVAQRIVAEGLQDRFLVQSFSATELLAVKAVDPSIRTMALGNNITVESAIAHGYWAVSPERTAFLARPDRAEYQAAMQEAGIKVIPYVANALAHAEELIALGVDGFFTDRPAHVVRAGQRIPSGSTTTIRPPDRYDLATWAWTTSLPKAVYPVVDGEGCATLAGWEGLTEEEWALGASSKIEVAGRRTADTPADQTIRAILKVTANHPGGSTSRYISFRWAWTGEVLGASTHGENGFQLDYTMAGAIRLFARAEGTAVQIATASWPPLVVGEQVPLRVDMTATGVTVTRTDTQHSITAEDSSVARGGFMQVFSGGLIPAICEVSITY